MSDTYNKLLQTRKRSHEREKLVEQYASEEGISYRAARHRLSKPERLDGHGKLLRLPRKDKGTIRAHSAAKFELAKQALLADRTSPVGEIAKRIGLTRQWVSRVNSSLP